MKNDSHKLGIINRFHRTIKDKLTKHFIASNSVNWIDVIGDIVNNYNNTIHRSIGVAPIKVNNAIEIDIINEKRNETKRLRDKIPENFDIGDTVIIKRKKKLFDDKHLSKFTGDVYTVVKIMNNSVQLSDIHSNLKVEKVSNIQKIRPVGEVLPKASYEDTIKAASNENSLQRKLKLNGIDLNNILTTKRERRRIRY